MAATTPTVLTVSGTPTDFIPLVTAYSAPTSCSNYIYKQEGPTYLAFDPYYGSYIDTKAVTCQPSQVITWWSQASGAVTTTALGTTFNCPALYQTVATSTASGFQHVYCCPSSYDAYVLWSETPGAFASQCTSQATPGGGFSYMSLIYGTDGLWSSSTTTSTSLSSTITIFGIPVNGYNKIDEKATSTSGSGSSATGVSTSETSGSATSGSGATASTSAAASGGGLSTGASIGIGVGVGVGGVLVVLGAVALWWRKRRRPQKAADEYSSVPPTAPTGGYGYDTQQTAAATPVTELAGHYGGKYAPDNTFIYEAPADQQYRVPELDSNNYTR